MRPKTSDKGEQKMLLDLLTSLHAELEACEDGASIVEALDSAYAMLGVNRSDDLLKKVLYVNKVYIQYVETSARYEKLRSAAEKTKKEGCIMKRKRKTVVEGMPVSRRALASGIFAVLCELLGRDSKFTANVFGREYQVNKRFRDSRFLHTAGKASPLSILNRLLELATGGTTTYRIVRTYAAGAEVDRVGFTLYSFTKRGVGKMLGCVATELRPGSKRRKRNG